MKTSLRRVSWLDPGRIVRPLAIAMVALAVFFFLLQHVGQRYRIESRSMEPALHGHGATGDIVLVDKAGLLRSHAAARLARFDTVVLRDPRMPEKPLVKRLGSTGDEMVRISDGDLFVRPLTGGPWQRIQKDPLGDRDLRLTFFEFHADRPGDLRPYLSGLRTREGFLSVPACGEDAAKALAGITADFEAARGRCLASTTRIDASFLDATGRRVAASARGDNDIGLEVDLRLAAECRGVALALHQHDRWLAVAYERDGRLTWTGVPAGAVASGPPLPQQFTVAFGYLDGRVFLTLDDQCVALMDYAFPADTESDRNGVRAGALGPSAANDAPARATRVRLFHDIHYQADNRPFVGIAEYRIEPGQVFVLGDNTFESADSRSHGPYPADAILGRPLAILGPWRRARWLPR